MTYIKGVRYFIKSDQGNSIGYKGSIMTTDPQPVEPVKRKPSPHWALILRERVNVNEKNKARRSNEASAPLETWIRVECLPERTIEVSGEK